MKIHLLTCADVKYRDHQIRLDNLIKNDLRFTHHSVNLDDFKKTEFYYDHYPITSQPRGCGYWLWKPYYITNLIKTLKTDQNPNSKDWIFYLDCGDTFNPNGLYNYLQNKLEHIILVPGVFKQSQFTKRDAFINNNSDTAFHHNRNQLEAGIILTRPTYYSTVFFEAWLKMCTNYLSITDTLNQRGLPNLPDFIDHRHDQSLLTILSDYYLNNSVLIDNSVREFVQCNIQ